MAWLRDDYISAREGVSRREPRPLSQKSLLNIHTDLCALYTWAISPGIELAATHIFHTIERPEADTPVIETFARERSMRSTMMRTAGMCLYTYTITASPFSA